MIIYRLSWEMVKQACLYKYCNADPTWHKNTTQIVPNSQIPDEDWYLITKETGDPWQQYHTLKRWASEDREFIRHVRLEQAEVNPPEWEPSTANQKRPTRSPKALPVGRFL